MFCSFFCGYILVPPRLGFLYNMFKRLLMFISSVNFSLFFCYSREMFFFFCTDSLDGKFIWTNFFLFFRIWYHFLGGWSSQEVRNKTNSDTTSHHEPKALECNQISWWEFIQSSKVGSLVFASVLAVSSPCLCSK
jgi:hypothetical protein